MRVKVCTRTHKLMRSHTIWICVSFERTHSTVACVSQPFSLLFELWENKRARTAKGASRESLGHTGTEVMRWTNAETPWLMYSYSNLLNHITMNLCFVVIRGFPDYIIFHVENLLIYITDSFMMTFVCFWNITSINGNQHKPSSRGEFHHQSKFLN